VCSKLFYLPANTSATTCGTRRRRTCRMSALPSSPFLLGVLAFAGKGPQQFSPKMYGMPEHAFAEFRPNVRLCYASRFPSAVKIFEALGGKTNFGLITEN